MDRRRKHLEKELIEAASELDAAKKPSEICAAPTKRRLALQGLARLEEEQPNWRPTSRGRGRTHVMSLANAGQHPKREIPQQNGRRSASTAAEPASP